MTRILIVDDEAPVRKMVRNMLKGEDYEIIEAADGVEAQALCNENPVDLLITDIVMPNKHGIDLIRDIKADFPDMPVIAISGGGGVSGRFDYLEIGGLVGANQILRKPFTADAMRNIVKATLEGEN